MSTKKVVLAALTLANVVTFPAAVVTFFSGAIALEPGAHFFLGAAILNGIVFLLLYRHAHRNPNLGSSQRDRWEIILFFGSPVAPLLYLKRHVLAQRVSAGQTTAAG